MFRFMRSKVFHLCLWIIVLSVFYFPVSGDAALLEGHGALGAFAAELIYQATNSSSATLSLSITNISPVALGGFITAVVFNNPSGLITSIGLNSSDPDFGLIGGSDYNNGINAQPFGYFDMGVSTGGAFQGGGQPSVGIGVGQTAMFQFLLTGTNLDLLTINDFFSELSDPQGNPDHVAFFVARFRGFTNGGSDKVPGEVDGNGNPVIPEPGTLFLMGSGVFLFGLRRRSA